MINRRMTNKQNVHRRIGGLEIRQRRCSIKIEVHRRIGGLESAKVAQFMP